MSAACHACGGITVDQPAQPNTTYLLPVSCPRDGTPLEHVTGSLYAGTEASAVCRCPACHRSYQIIVHLRPVVDPASRLRTRQRTAARSAS